MFSRFLRFQISTWFCILLGISIFMVARAIMLFHFGDDAVLHRTGEIRRAFLIGFLFDLQILSLLLSISVVVALLLLPLKKLFSIYHCWVYPVICSIILTICITFAIINFYYYQYFNSQIDLNFLEITAGQANATLAFIWQKYPVITVFTAIVLFMMLIIFLLLKMHHRVNQLNWYHHQSTKIVISIAAILLYIVALSGGYINFKNISYIFTSPSYVFGIKNQEAYFSKSHLINQLCINGVRAFVRVYYIRYRFVKPHAVSKIDGLHAANSFFNKKFKLPQFSLNNLYTYTPKKVYTSTHPKPNVVFVQMESMGRHFLLFNNKKNNLLGALGPYFERDFVFKNFVSAANNTPSALSMLMINTPLDRVFQNYICPNTISSSVAKPFKEAGYKTIFLTSGSAYFARLDRFLPKQDFDELLDRENILDAYPRAETDWWGVYDGTMFQYAYDILQKADHDHQPIFIYINTATNHAPYSIPKSYHPYLIEVPPGYPERMNVSDGEAHTIFATYQYANDSLGKFIEQIDKSAWGKHTIIGASGDHNLHELRPHYPNYKEYGLRYEVPFYLHIPKDYQTNIVYDPNRIGSHKDIFPTLYSLALSRAHYLNLGNNLLSIQKTSFEFGVNLLTVILPEGIITLYENELPKFYPWLNGEKIYVGDERPLSDSQNKILQRIQSYQYLLNWQLNEGALLAGCH